MATLSVARTVTRCFFFALSAWTFSTPCMMPQMPGGQMPGGQPMNAKDDPFSPENIAQVAEEISKLTPEQQDQLYKESLDFLSKELNLSPEEVEKMITEEFTQGAAPAPDMPQPKGPSAEILKSETESIPKVEEKIVPVKDLNDIAALLKNISDITDTIMRKASGLPDLPSRVDRWVEQKKLTSWQSNLTWASFKKQLELLVQKLGKLQSKDPRTNTYLYLPELLNNVSLKNNLERIYRSLKTFNTKFTTSTFDIDLAFDDPLSGAGSLSAEAKDALLGILNTYGDAFYTQSLFKDLDALVQKFDPAAQKLRTSEEERTKKALEESKKPRTTTGIKIGGSKSDSSGGRDSYYSEPSADGGYYPGSSYNGYPSYPSYGNDSTQPSNSKADGSSSASGKGKNGGDKESATGEDKKTKEVKEDKYYEDKIKSARTTSTYIAKNILVLAGKIAEDLSTPDSAFQESKKAYKDLIAEIEYLSTSISNKNFSTKTKEYILEPIRDSYATHKEVLTTGAKKIEERAKEQQPNKELMKTAQKRIKHLKTLLTDLETLEENTKLNAEQITKITNVTKKPLESATKEEAQKLLQTASHEPAMALDKEESIFKRSTSLSELATNIASLEGLINTIAAPTDKKNAA
jgi:hypothetical protein